MLIEEDGVGKCPFDPLQNSTAVYTGTLICSKKRKQVQQSNSQTTTIKTMQTVNKLLNHRKPQ